ncbi:MAG: PduM family microcompartment protein, partial [Aeromonas sp.]
MPTLAPSQIEQIVEQIVTLLRQRERSVLAVRQDDLERGLDAAVWVRHAHLHIQQPTAAFMQQLACADSAWRAVQSVHEAWSLGV